MCRKIKTPRLAGRATGELGQSFLGRDVVVDEEIPESPDIVPIRMEERHHIRSAMLLAQRRNKFASDLACCSCDEYSFVLHFYCAFVLSLSLVFLWPCGFA